MTDQEINAKIAEACGWEDVAPLKENLNVWIGKHGGYYQNLEEYCNDLNAMHEAEETLTLEQCDELKRVLNGKCHKFFAYRNKEEYQHHSAMYVSSHGQPCGESVSYTETSFAQL